MTATVDRLLSAADRRLAGLRFPARTPALVLGAAMAVVGVAVIWWARGATFWYDEWSIVLYRREGGIGALFAEYNGNVIALLVAVYRVLLPVTGLDTYWPYQVVAVGVHLGVVWLLFTYVRRRVGDVAALAVAGAFLVIGMAWEPIVWMAASNHALAALTLVAVLVLLDRRTRRAFGWAVALLGVLLLTYGHGVAIAAGMVAELVLQRRWRRAGVVVATVAAYGLLLVVAGSLETSDRLLAIPGARQELAQGAATLRMDNLPDVPGFVVDQVSGSIGGFFGQGRRFGKVAAALVAAGVAVLLVRARKLSPRMVALLVVGGALWGATALSRAHFPGNPVQPRYVYTGVVVIVLFVAEVLRDVKPRRVVVALAVLAIAAGAVENVRTLHDVAGAYGGIGDTTRADAAALDLAGDAVDPGFAPDAALQPGITTGPLRAAEADTGQLAQGSATLASLSPALRTRADRVLRRALGVALVAPSAEPLGPAPTLVGAFAATAAPEGACVRVTPDQAGGGAVELTAGPGALSVEPVTGPVGVAVRVARFGPVPERPDIEADLDGPMRLELPAGAVQDPWTVRLAVEGAVLVCGAT